MPAAGVAAAPTEPRALGLVKVAYTNSEVCDILSIGMTTLNTEVNSGRLVAVKRGKSRLFLACDIAAYLLALRDEAFSRRAAAEGNGEDAIPPAK